MNQKTKLLIIGGEGMLGHRLWASLGGKYDVYATIRRNKLGILNGLKGIKPENVFYEVDVRDFKRVERVVRDLNPDVVINCVGIVRSLIKDPSSYDIAVTVNSLFPHQLAKLCDGMSKRLIHFSTDCVFDGKRGNYSEQDIPNPTDFYGRTKALGEIDYSPNTLTVRTSIIGRELSYQKGLTEWFLSNNGSKVKGYSKAIFSGFPTHSVAKIVDDYILPNQNLTGIMHIASRAIDKFSLLSLIREELNLDITIEKDDSFEKRMDLNCQHFQKATGYQALEWSHLIHDINIDTDFYNSLTAPS